MPKVHCILFGGLTGNWDNYYKHPNHKEQKRIKEGVAILKC